MACQRPHARVAVTNAVTATTRITNQGASLHSYQKLVTACFSRARVSGFTHPIVSHS